MSEIGRRKEKGQGETQEGRRSRLFLCSTFLVFQCFEILSTCAAKDENSVDFLTDNQTQATRRVESTLVACNFLRGGHVV